MLTAVEFALGKGLAPLLRKAGQGRGGAVAAAHLERGGIGRAMLHGDILAFAGPPNFARFQADRIAAASKEAVKAVSASF